MFSRIRKRFTYANVVLTLALVFAMSGGAYAAGKYLITSTKQISPKVLKSLKGAKGAPGATGAQGPAGAAGKEGPAGKEGGAGKEGPGGKEGPQGVPGIKGEKGVTGSPWTPDGTLPSKATEKGAWSISTTKEMGVPATATSISFTIPLAKALGATEVHYVNNEGTEEVSFNKEIFEFKAVPTTASCTGTAAEPTAAPGNLCVYETGDERAQKLKASLAKALINPASEVSGSFIIQGASTTGARIVILPEPETSSFVIGTWALTAP